MKTTIITEVAIPTVIRDTEVGPAGPAGPGYNFIETVPSSDITTDDASVTITGKTMRRVGVGDQSPAVIINGALVAVTKTPGDENIYTFSLTAALAVGASPFVIVSDNGSILIKTITITRSGVAPSCSLTHSAYFKAGIHTITLTSDYDLFSVPTLSSSIGSLASFTGSGKVWVAALTITAGLGGNGLFSGVTLRGDGGTGHTILSGASYVVDTVIPVILTTLFSRTLWNYENGAMALTVAMGESTIGFTGFVDLSSFGLSASTVLSPAGDNMTVTFTPVRIDAGPEPGKNIRVADRCGNSSIPKTETDNQLQVIAYRLTPQNITFPAYSAVSNVLAGGKVITTDASTKVQWGAGQTMSGALSFGTDFTIDDHNKVHLDGTRWADQIAANALGLLNVDVWEN